MIKVALGFWLGGMCGMLIFSHHYEYNSLLDIWQPRSSRYVYQRAVVVQDPVVIEHATPTPTPRIF